MLIIFHVNPFDSPLLQSLKFTQSYFGHWSPDLSTMLKETPDHCLVKDKPLFPVFDEVACSFSETKPRSSSADQ